MSNAITFGYRGDPDAERWVRAFDDLESLVKEIAKLITGLRSTNLSAALEQLREFTEKYASKKIPYTEREQVGKEISQQLTAARSLMRQARREALVEKKLADHAERVNDQMEPTQRRRALIEKKLADHATRVKGQETQQEAPSQVLYVAPHEFDIAGHADQKITSGAYANYARGVSEANGEKPFTEVDAPRKRWVAFDAPELGWHGVEAPGRNQRNEKYVDKHYMAGLTLTEEAYKKRMEVEDADESVPDHRGHSGGYFERKPPGDTSTKQTFHPGKHNPHQNDFNLEHRLTGGVPADSPTGAYTSVSSKFISDEVSIEALKSAKNRAAAELQANPAQYKNGGGKFFKNYSVTLDLRKPTGVGFEGAAGQGQVTGITDLFGNNSAYEGAYKKTLAITGSVNLAEIGAKTARRSMQQGQDRPTRKARVKAAVSGAARNATLTDSQALNIAKAAEGAKTWSKSDISTIAPGSITATQTGLTLKSIDPSGDHAVFEVGPGQHFPANTPPQEFKMVKFGNDVLI